MRKKSHQIGDKFIIWTLQTKPNVIDTTNYRGNKINPVDSVNIPIQGEFMITSFDECGFGVNCLKCGSILDPPLSFASLSSHVVGSQCTNVTISTNILNTDMAGNKYSNGNDMKNSKQEPLLCGICNLRFSKRSHLKRHIFTVHDIGDYPIYECKICSKVFTQRYSLTRHIRTVHLVSDARKMDELITTNVSNNHQVNKNSQANPQADTNLHQHSKQYNRRSSHHEISSSNFSYITNSRGKKEHLKKKRPLSPSHNTTTIKDFGRLCSASKNDINQTSKVSAIGHKVSEHTSGCTTSGPSGCKPVQLVHHNDHLDVLLDCNTLLCDKELGDDFFGDFCRNTLDSGLERGSYPHTLDWFNHCHSCKE